MLIINIILKAEMSDFNNVKLVSSNLTRGFTFEPWECNYLKTHECILHFITLKVLHDKNIISIFV